MYHHSSIVYVVYLIGHFQSYTQRMEAQRNVAFVRWTRSRNKIQVHLAHKIFYESTELRFPEILSCVVV